MAQLIDLMAPHLSDTDQQIADRLNASTVEKRDSQQWTWTGLLKRFGPTVCGQLDELLAVMPGMGPIRSALGGPGIDFSDDVTQDALELWRGQELLAPHVDPLKAIGRWTVAPWEDAGLLAPVTVEQVAEAREMVTRWQWAATVANEVLKRTDLSISEMKAAIAAID